MYIEIEIGKDPENSANCCFVVRTTNCRNLAAEGFEADAPTDTEGWVEMAREMAGHFLPPGRWDCAKIRPCHDEGGGIVVRWDLV